MGRLVSEGGRLPLVWGELQDETARGKARLRPALLRVIGLTSYHLLLQRIHLHVPVLPALALGFCRAALQRLAGASDRRISVAAIANDLRLSQRTLERRFKTEGIVAPKELLDWMIMLAAVDTAQREGTEEWWETGGALGLLRARIVRSRVRLSKAGFRYYRTEWDGPREVFENTFSAFASRCRKYAGKETPIRYLRAESP